MRIACHNGARIWGGAERATTRLLSGLQDRGHDVHLLCNSELVISHALDSGVAATRCVIGGDAMLPHALNLARVLRRIRPDAFIVSTYKKLFFATLGARIAGVPRVVARIGLETDTPRHPKYRFALKHWTDGVAVNAERIVAPFAELEGFGAEKVALIHNGVLQPPLQSPPRAVRRELGIHADSFVVGTLARLDRQKRLDRLIEAVALLQDDTQCVIAGSGDQFETLAEKTRAVGIDRRVHLLGPREDVGDVVSAFDVFVVASDREGHSSSMLEAMSWGIPVVSTPVSGADESLLGEQPAGIVTDFSSESIAVAIKTLRDDPLRRAEMGRSARHRAETQFSFEVMLDKWEAFLGVREAPAAHLDAS